MPHDKNENLIEVGDRVVVPAKQVEKVSAPAQ